MANAVLQRNCGVAASIQFLTIETKENFGVAGNVYTFRDLIGSGSFGSVYRCYLQSDADAAGEAGFKDYAVKVIDGRRLADVLGQPLELVVLRLQREVEILMLLGEHPNIVQLRAAYFSRATNRYYIVTEWVQGGDLFHAIVRRRKPFSEKDAKTMFLQLASAVLFCHERGIAHRDLKLENVLIEDMASYRVRLCDYGQAKMLQMEGYTDTSQTLTSPPAYTAPEVKIAVASAQPYDAFKLDAFGLGIILYGMMCNALPDAAKGTGYTKHNRWQALTEKARHLIQSLLNPDPQQRISVRDVRQHPWFGNEETILVEDMSRSPSKATSLGQPTIQLNVDTIIASQRVLMAVQRERGACCWALSSEEGEQNLGWQRKAVDECFNDLFELISGLLSEDKGTAAWVNLNTGLRNANKAVVTFRIQSARLIFARESTHDPEEDFKETFQEYTGVISILMKAVNDTVTRLLGASTPSHMEQHLRLLQITAEQLGRERAFLCSHIERPETLRISSVIVDLSQVIGARKMLLGTVDSAMSYVVTGQGLAHGLRLSQAAPFSDEELGMLESAEARVLSARRGTTPPVAEAWHLLTQMIDKVHQHIFVCLAKVLVAS